MTLYDSAFTRPPAPPPLDLVQAFLNSVDLEDGTEAFGTTESLGAWAGQHGVAATDALTEEDRRRAIATREALRDIVEHGASTDTTRALQDALGEIAVALRISDHGDVEIAPHHDGIDVLLARIMTSVHDAMVAGSWERLKICRNDACRWAFYDASKNHSGVWCSMATCGSKAKARAYRGRARKKEIS